MLDSLDRGDYRLGLGGCFYDGRFRTFDLSDRARLPLGSYPDGGNYCFHLRLDNRKCTVKSAIVIWVLLGAFITLLCGLVIATAVAVVRVLLHVGFSPSALWLWFTAYMVFVGIGVILKVKIRS